MLPSTQSYEILKATKNKADILAKLISNAYQDVAKKFKLTMANCPKHPSNCSADWINSDFERNVEYYILYYKSQPIGCVAMEKANDRTLYIERLSILPEFRHQGLGKKLVEYIVKKAVELKVGTIGIGIIAEQEDLKKWYESLNFVFTGTKKFEHLPFTVGFMEFYV